MIFAASAAAVLAAGGALLHGERAVAKDAAGVDLARMNFAPVEPARVDFAREVLPTLAARCFRCHGGVREMAGLNLSDYARVTGVLKSGHVAVVARSPAQSAMFTRVFSNDADRRMPPEGAPLSKSGCR